MPIDARSRSQSFHDTNQRLRQRLQSITKEFGQESPASSEDISALLSELTQVGVSLRSEAIPARGVDPDLDRELDEYRQNLEQLRGFLPAIHRWLLAERDRIEGQQSRVQSVTGWAGALRQTV